MQNQDTIIIKTNKADTLLIVTSNFEKLDVEALERNGKSSETGNNSPLFYGWIIDKDGYYKLRSGYKIGGYNEFVFPDSSCFRLQKKFYSNGNIKEKGLNFGTNGFKKGIWYEFNEQGVLTKQTDYDKFTKFSWEDVLAYLQQQKIEVPLGYSRQGGFHTNVTKTYFYKTNSCTWTIDWLKKADIIQRITLDGNSGKVLDKQDLEYDNI